MTDPRFADLLERVMGLNPASIGIASVERAVAERMRILGSAGPDAYWQALHGASGELQALIEAVVVPETWFFRDPAAFGAMARECLARAAADPLRSLRLLSLPCSTGEEPFTMAMALIDAGLPASRFRIDAVDISLQALDLARRGLYGRNSFRGADLAFRDRHFDAVGRDWRLRDGLRAPVQLMQGNVIAEGFLAGAEPYDIIFCRNLLIYFDPATQGRASGVLARLLRRDGVLFAGHSESGVVSAHGFASAQIPMAFAFRHDQPRPARSPGLAPSIMTTARSVPAPAVSRPRAVAPKTVVPKTGAPRAAAPAPAPPAAGPDELWRLLNAGRLDEAEQACRAYLLARGPCADGYLVQGLIRDARGDEDGAAAAYRKALYLEPGHAEALDHLALLMRRQGDEAGARLLANRLQRQSRSAR